MFNDTFLTTAAYAYNVSPLRLLLIAPDPLARSALAAMLGDDGAWLLVAREDNSAEFDDLLDLHNPDIVLYDVGWQNSQELPDLRDIELPVLVLVPDQEGADEAWQAGARGVLERSVTTTVLATALRSLSQRLVVISADLLPTPLTQPSLPQNIHNPLTDREHEVLALLAQGLTNRAIAFQLSISDHTVKFHVNGLLTKLGAQSRTEAAVKAARLGLLSL